MKFYKVFTEDGLVGVSSSNDFRRYYKRGYFIGPATEETGEVISCQGGLYRDNWMRSVINNTIEYLPATIREITETEYLSLKELDEEVIEVDYPEIVVPEQVINPFDEMTIEYVKEAKIQELSRACTAAIEGGVTVNNKHFSLSTSDQLNLLAAENAASAGEDVLYHADGEDYRFFTAEEIQDIVSAAAEWRVYNASYFKALKAYINSLDNVETIMNITYGDEVPEEFKSEILKELENK